MFVAGLRALVLVGACALPVSVQATLHIFVSPLNGANESPPVDSMGNGSATLVLDDANWSFNLILVGVGLSSPIVGAQFESSVSPPAPLPTLTKPASFQQADGYAFSAMYLNAAGSQSLLDLLQAGNVSINLATEDFTLGEIKGHMGQLTPIPEPATWALAAAGLIVLAGSALRRRSA